MADAAPVTCGTCELHAEAVFRVEGMDCHEEVVILERRLKPLTGVEVIVADVIGQRLHVQYDAAKLTTSTMVEAVGETGMRMWLEHEAPAGAGADVRARLWLMLATAAGIAAGLAAGAAGWGAAGVALLVTATALGAVYPMRRAVAAIRMRTADINVLMVIAVAGALVLGEWVEAATVVFLFAAAQWLEARTLERARQAIRALVDLSPRQALVRRDGVEQWVPVEVLRPGDTFLVRPGDKVPVDGRIAAGRSDVNEAPITGESLPGDKAPGDEVFAGTINGHGALDVEVTRVGRDTRLARIIHLVEQAQARRAPVQAFVDRFARIYTPAVVGLAAVIAVVPPVLLGAEASVWVYRALVLLVVSCPCALVISTPVSIVAALSSAARSGVLVKGGAYLERLAAVRTVAFDKTGTLTRGVPDVTAVIPAPGGSADDLLREAAAIETRSEHPIGRAIVRHARARGLQLPETTAFRATPGRGAEARIGARRVIVGNEALFDALGVHLPPEAAAAASARRAGQSVVHVVADGRWRGAVAVGDRAREAARETLELLRDHGIRRIVMLTGDHPETARAMAASLGVDAVHGGLMPDQKHDLVATLRREHPVMMVGDGINDAPALAAADVGVAMGAAGSDAALETADVALMSDELLKLPYVLRLARATLRNIKTNVAVSLLLKAAFLVLAVTGDVTLWMAVLADTGATVIVVANALRLLRTR